LSGLPGSFTGRLPKDAAGLTTDRTYRRDTLKQRQVFAKVRDSERAYAAKLRKIAAHVGEIVKALGPDYDDEAVAQVTASLNGYAEILRPWANATAKRMLAETARRDELAWRRYAALMGVELRRQIQETPLGGILRQLQEEQVALITSIPIEAGRRVQEIARGTLYTGARPKALIEEILRTGDVTKNRATLIARTETAKASSMLTQARATNIGSPGYIWRTVHDIDVRRSHKKMEGQFIKWDQPPEVEPGHWYHAGQTYNCRCFAEPILLDD
jgi:SPP1 gp7 family putative phage head morphogenesis protein